MANRSYLYTVDKVPARKGKSKSKSKPQGVSEFPWDIPLAHKILVHKKAKVCPSAIWDHDIGVAGERAAGTELLLEFLDVLGQGKVANEEDFADAVRETKKFLGSKKRKGKFFLLEAGEIFDMVGTDLGKQAKALATKDIPATIKRVRAAIAGKDKKWLTSLRKKWEDELGVGDWSDVLYFDFT